MSTESGIETSIDAAADAVGSVWPLHSFVTANPLAGFEDRPFHEAVADAERLLGGDGYPSAEVFRRAFEAGQIDPEVLSQELAEHGYDLDTEAALDRMAAEDRDTATDAASVDESATTATDRVDAVLTKWLAVFLDQGRAEWPMPNREQGFYAAIRRIAPHDRDIPDGEAFTALPESPTEAIREHLADQPLGEWQDVFEFQLAALPGWTGYLKQRAAGGDAWQTEYPITLSEYLAVRLTLVDLFDAPIAPEEVPDEGGTDTELADDRVPLPEVWLTAWEATYRAELVGSLTETSAATTRAADGGRPDAQLVFCIDTRSEIIRRHVEAQGDYETHGYAGFFGIPMRYAGYDSDVTVDACPPILDAQHRIADHPRSRTSAAKQEHDRWHDTLGASQRVMKRLKSNAATAFSFVESAGVGYGAALAARTLLPARVYDLLDAADERAPHDHEFCEPSVDYNPDSVHELREGLTLDEKVEYAATAFELMGWERFARVVVFAGHASQTANNPFDSSLDCGACAGNPGGPNARVLAAICNDDEVRAALRERGIEIPEDTVFVAGEHNTTTDEVDLYDSTVPDSHEDDIAQLRADLDAARDGAAAERAGDMGADADSGVHETQRRAADWAETRPEWGLAGNAGFVVGPRSLTEDLDLDGRSFLHSYDWTTDPDGDALETIMTGPMVVTQWINSQYYFATVDNAVYGSGSKVTQNPVGNVGVYQGNGGDLLTGLPLQSLLAADDDPYHQPLRLSTVIHAPVDRLTEVLSEHEHLAALLDNDWLSLTVVDPTQEHRAFHYESDLDWEPVAPRAATTPEITGEPTAADD
ncbi:DUF2309 domain-containing protein [Haloarchaeobius amylolyticus]|uniref:DUF2309 domain-containing protein n=1 Tax=Haloarchaeobius amylolyticus TaxID=1198296 RepID=UPI00226D935B|nr:DUF2309 domain-containing protein [Haloarchaeobius amylolyticus]